MINVDYERNRQTLKMGSNLIVIYFFVNFSDGGGYRGTRGDPRAHAHMVVKASNSDILLLTDIYDVLCRFC